jgi:hypothetical protein
VVEMGQGRKLVGCCLHDYFVVLCSLAPSLAPSFTSTPLFPTWVLIPMFVSIFVLIFRVPMPHSATISASLCLSLSTHPCFMFVFASVLSPHRSCSLCIFTFSTPPHLGSNYVLCLRLVDTSALFLVLRILVFLHYLLHFRYGIIPNLDVINEVLNTNPPLHCFGQ